MHIKLTKYKLFLGKWALPSYNPHPSPLDPRERLAQVLGLLASPAVAFALTPC